jgi:hypothetical protein
LVLLRHPWRNARAMGLRRYAAFLLQVGGTYLSLMLSPVFWTLFFAYLLTGSPKIIALFPGPLYYSGMALLIGGNLGLLSVSLYTALRRQSHGTVRYLMVLTPVWWMLLSAASYLATLELALPRWRPTWNKTAHGVRHLSWSRRAQLALAGAMPARPTLPALPSLPALPTIPSFVSRAERAVPDVLRPSRPVPSVVLASDPIPAMLSSLVPAAPLPERTAAFLAGSGVRPQVRFLEAHQIITGRPRPAAAPVVPAPAAAVLPEPVVSGVREAARPQVRFLPQHQVITSRPVPETVGAEVALASASARVAPVFVRRSPRRRGEVREAPRAEVRFLPEHQIIGHDDIPGTDVPAASGGRRERLGDGLTSVQRAAAEIARQKAAGRTREPVLA